MILDSGFIAYFNAIIVLTLVVMIVNGYFSGIVKQFFGLFSLLIALIIALMFSPGFANLWRITSVSMDSINSDMLVNLLNYKLNSIIWFGIIFVTTAILLSLLIKVFDLIVSLPVLMLFNKFLGAFFGFIKAIIVLLIFSVILSSPIFLNGSTFKEQTLLRYVDIIFSSSFISNVLEEGKALQNFIVEPNTVTEQQMEWVEKWLADAHYSMSEIQEILGSMQGSES